MRRLSLPLAAILISAPLLLLLALGGSRLTPANRQAQAARLIRASLLPGASQRQVIRFVISQDADYATISGAGQRRIVGSFPLVAPSAWGSYAGWGVPHQWLESYDRGVGFAFLLDGRGRMVGFRVYPPGVRP